MKKLTIIIGLLLIGIWSFGQFNGANIDNLTVKQARYDSTRAIANPLDLVPQWYVDQAVVGYVAKPVAEAATTTNITLSGNQIVDGFSATTDDTILVKDQTNPAENGIYFVGTPWVRADYANAWAEIYKSSVFVLRGTVNANSTYSSYMEGTGTLESDTILWNLTAKLPDITGYRNSNLNYERGRVNLTQGTWKDSTEIIYTEGNLTESISGMAITGTGNVVNGDLNIELQSGYQIPSTSQLNDAQTAYDEKIDSFYKSIVIRVEKLRGVTQMYDLHVPNGNSYVANGIVTHNSGKTALISTLMAYELFEVISWESPARHFGLMTGKSGKGATIGVTCLATSTKQADYGVFANMRNMIEENDFFDQWFDLRFRDQFIESDKKNTIAQVLAPHAGRAAGFTNKCAIFDELDFFQESETLLDVQKVYDKVCNSTETFKREGKIIAISSLNTATGIMMREYRDAKLEQKRPNPVSLGFMFKTWEANPTLTEEDLRRSCGNNRIKFLRDFANQPEVGAGLQFPEGVITDPTIVNLLYLDFENIKIIPETVYIPHVIAIDPAWKNDSFGVACGYKRGNIITIDGVRKFTKDSEAEAYIKPSDIRNFIVNVVKNVKTNAFVYDVFNQSPELIEFIENNLGIDTIEHIVKKEDYDRWRGMQEGTFETNLKLVHEEQLISECNELIVKQTPGGKTKVDHLHSSSKDSSDTVANCIWYLEDDDALSDMKFTPLGPMVFV